MAKQQQVLFFVFLSAAVVVLMVALLQGKEGQQPEVKKMDLQEGTSRALGTVAERSGKPCDPSAWDAVIGNNICGPCEALIRFRKGAGIKSCSDFCESEGLACVAQYDDKNNSCKKKRAGRDIGCKTVQRSSDNICKCVENNRVVTDADFQRPTDYGSTRLTISETLVNLSDPLPGVPDQNSTIYRKYELKGNGTQVKVIDGVVSIVVDATENPHATDYNIIYCNNLTEPVTMHQHGLTPPNNLDGVPLISQYPIQPNRCDRIDFRVEPKNYGTHFVHSHYSWEHERGLAAPVIINGPLPPDYPEPIKGMLDQATDHILFLEDFVSFAADNTSTNDDGWKQRQTFDVLKEGWEDEQPFNFSECMQPGDDFDVAFRFHLANNQQFGGSPVVMRVEKNEYVRLRIINSASMSSYLVLFNETDWGGCNLKPTLVAVDGQYIQPYEVEKDNLGFWVGVAQRGDVLLRIPEHMDGSCFPIIARNAMSDLPEDPFGDVKRQQSGVLMCVGDAEDPTAGTYSNLAVGKSATGKFAGPAPSGMSQEKALRAFFPLADRPVSNNFTISLTGDNGFMSIDMKSYKFFPGQSPQAPDQPDTTLGDQTAPWKTNERPLLIESKERVCITLVNYNADSHAMHLHGHSYQVRMIDGVEFSGAMRDTYMTAMGECRNATICFDADNPGVWPFHCHMTYHVSAPHPLF